MESYKKPVNQPSFLITSSEEEQDPSKVGQIPQLYQRGIWDAIKSQLSLGIKKVLHSDTDAIFHDDNIWTVLNDPILQDVDLIASTDHCYPVDVCKSWNYKATINPGFMMFRNTPKMNNVIDHLIQVWDENKQPKDGHAHCDLFMLNRYLANDVGCIWDTNNTLTSTGEQVRLGNCHGLKIAGLTDLVVHGVSGGKYVTHSHQEIERNVHGYC